MNKKILKPLIKSIWVGVIWSIILVLIGLVIVSFNNYTLKDVLFVESILLIIFAIFSALSGNPTGLSLQGMGQNNAQYVSNANLEISRIENEKNKSNLKLMFNMGVSTVQLILGGIIGIIIDIMI